MSRRAPAGAFAHRPTSLKDGRADLGRFHDCPGRGAVPLAESANEPEKRAGKPRDSRKTGTDVADRTSTTSPTAHDDFSGASRLSCSELLRRRYGVAN